MASLRRLLLFLILFYACDIDGQTLSSNSISTTEEGIIAEGVVSNAAILIDRIDEDCSSDGLTYKVEIEIIGGDPPYNVNGVEIAGNIYNSQAIPSGISYDFTISDNGNAQPVNVIGILHCSCSNKAGKLDVNQIELCEGEDFLIEYISQPITPPNYVDVFVLHNGTPSVIGTVYQIIYDNMLVFDGSIPINQNLLLTPVSALIMGPIIDFDDACVQLGNSTPLIWKSDALVTLDYPTVPLCEGELFQYSIKINFKNYPVNINISGPGYDEDIVITSSANYTKEVLKAETGTFTITILDDICLNPNSELSFSINTENCGCDVYTFIPIDSVCSSIDLIDLSGWVVEGAKGVWSINQSSSTTPPTINQETLAIGTSSSGVTQLSFEPTEVNSCDSIYTFEIYIENYVEVEILQSNFTRCEANDETINLNQSINTNGVGGNWISLSGINPNALIDGNIDLSLLDPGNYTFEFVRNDKPILCFYNPVLIELVITPPLDYVITSNNPACFGDDGNLAVEIINGSTDINGIAINGNNIAFPFDQQLSSGIYNIVLTDQNLCNYYEQVLITDPAPTSVQLEGEIIENIEGDKAIVNAYSMPEGSVDYEWYLNGELYVTGMYSVLTFIINDDTEISVIITNENGCTAEDIIILFSTKPAVDVILPNIFNANSVVGNDLFLIPPFETIAEVLDFTIYDRWGQKVFNATDYNPKIETIGWNGKSNGRNCVQGVYFYLVQYLDNNGQQQRISGDITLRR